MRDQGKDFRLILLKYNDSQNRSYDSGINLQYIKQQLVDLVECNNSSVHHSYFTSWQHGIWGLDTYEERKTIRVYQRKGFKHYTMVFERK